MPRPTAQAATVSATLDPGTAPLYWLHGERHGITLSTAFWQLQTAWIVDCVDPQQTIIGADRTAYSTRWIKRATHATALDGSVLILLAPGGKARFALRSASGTEIIN